MTLFHRKINKEPNSPIPDGKFHIWYPIFLPSLFPKGYILIYQEISN